MTYSKRFNDWNTKNKYMSVTAEQYTIIQQFLSQADEEIYKYKGIITSKNESSKNIRTALFKKAEQVKELKKYIKILSVGLGLIVITYSIIIYLSIK